VRVFRVAALGFVASLGGCVVWRVFAGALIAALVSPPALGGFFLPAVVREQEKNQKIINLALYFNAKLHYNSYVVHVVASLALCGGLRRQVKNCQPTGHTH
jgi:hypothetical protein